MHSLEMYPLKIEHVTKRYGHEVVVNDLSFTVATGRVTGFLGPNGAGKSTTMKVLLDLASADSGHATIAGTRYRDLADPARTVGVVLEPNAFHPGRSGRNHLRILADGSGIPSARIEELLEVVQLSHAADRHVGGYSLGMRQRLGIAAALLGDPPVLVLDEPGNGLDPQGIRWLRDLRRGRAAAGGTVFVSSHLLAEVEHLADQVVVISHGRLVAAGELAALEQAGTSVRSPEPGRLTQLLQEAGATVHPGPEGELGALLGLIGLGLIIAGVAAALPSTEHGFLVSAGDVIRLLAATTLAGAVGAVLGAGLGAAIRNLGGAVTAFVLALFMIPPLVVQLFNDAASWIPPALGAVISGVSTDLNTWAALAALLAYGVVPAAAGLISVQRRDVV